MGDILFLAHRLPYPPDRGDRIRSWHVLKALAKRAPVHVVALLDDAADRQHIAMVESVAASVTVVHRHPSKLRAMANAARRGTPASVEAFRSPELAARVTWLLAAHPVDCIYAFSGQMAAYVPNPCPTRFVMDFVDMDSAKFAALGGFANHQEGKRLLAWESATARRADLSLFVSEAEAALFRQKTGLSASVLENGIDLDRFFPQSVEGKAPESLIVFTGQMDYAPNIEAVTGFARNTLPQIRAAVPDATFAIVGRAPTAAVRALASDQVIVTGEMPDTRLWLARAAVVVAPLKLARGVQNKVLEAMAMGRAVVLSPGAAQGIDARDGTHFLVAEDPAAAVIALLTDPARATAIGTAARARMVERYGWDAQMAPLADMIEK